MKESNLHSLLEKADELRVTTFLKEVIGFVREIKPILDNINRSVADNVVKMPQASKKLSKVSEATEVATNEILNTVDTIMLKTEEMGSIVSQITSDGDNQQHKEKLNAVLNSINNDSTAIMMSLQVQDITSQQIAAVNNVLETVRYKLTKILSHMSTKEIIELLNEYSDETGIENVNLLHREIAFDPNAIDAITSKINRQDEVNDLIEQHISGTLDEADIDYTLNNVDIASLLEEVGLGSLDTDNSNTPNPDEEFSQDDIDALFGG